MVLPFKDLTKYGSIRKMGKVALKNSRNDGEKYNMRSVCGEWKKMRICVVTPMSSFLDGAAAPYLPKLIKILELVSDNIFVITGEFKWAPNDKKVHIINIPLYEDKQIIIKVFKYIISQLKISLELFRIFLHVDIVFFYFGTSLLFPMLTAKIFRKKVILMVTGSSSKSVRLIYKGRGGDLFYFITRIIAKINYILCDRIAMTLQSEIFINFLGLQKQRSKIVPFSVFFLDANFRINKKLQERKNIVGYIGRLYRDKGVLELAKAIPLVLTRNNNIRFLIVGDGPLMAEMKKELKKRGCLDKVEFAGWVPHEMLPDYFNEMRIHVLPSYTEAFGGTAIEAMACGAISIANSVGGMPDVIINNKTGFLLKDNLPQTIADRIIEIWNHPELAEIQKNASNFVEKTFSHEKAIERCKITFQ